MGINYASILLNFLGSLGLFVYGMHILSLGLQKSAGTRMKKILEALTRSKLMGVLLGAGVTAIIQSSSATTVMVVGFVNAGVMNLSQAVGVVMGANIGTTVTGWIVASIEWSQFIKPSTIAPVAIVTGAFLLMFANQKRHKQVGEIIVGLGVLFLGMSNMPDALKPLSELESFGKLFVSLGSNPFLGVLSGMLVTGVIQSSSVSVGILQSLALTGLVPWNATVYIIMGQNIGTCVTALLSSLGANKSAKSAAYIHLLFNVIGSVIFCILAAVYFEAVNPAVGAGSITLTQISLVHTSFNIATTLLLYPFTDAIIKVAVKMSGSGNAAAPEGAAVHLDDRVLNTPPFAIQCGIDELLRLAGIARDNVAAAMDAILTRDEHIAQKVYEREENIDMLEEAITTYLVKICGEGISEEENEEVTALFHTLSDIERVGDHAENIADLAVYMKEEDLSFSEAAVGEVIKMRELTLTCYDDAVSALTNGDKQAAERAIEKEMEMDKMKERFRTLHIARLTAGECNVRGGIAYLETLNNLERITDHAKNIAESVIK